MGVVNSIFFISFVLNSGILELKVKLELFLSSSTVTRVLESSTRVEYFEYLAKPYRPVV